jgi:hypothetical protein
MSTVILDTITGKSTATTITIGSTPVVSASANSMTIRGEGSAQTSIQQGLGKSWNNINGDDGASVDSFNAASFTDVGTGMYKWAFSNNMATATYVSTAGYGHTETADHGVRWPQLNNLNTTSETRGIVNNGNGDVGRVNVIIMGTLA